MGYRGGFGYGGGVGYSRHGGDVTAPEADVTAPAIPTNLTLTANDGEIVITWTDPPDTDLALIGIDRATVVTGPFTLIATVSKGYEGWTDDGLTNGTTYWYKISATDTSGNESAMSLAKSATPIAAASTQLIGDPAFDEVTLDADSRTWYDRLFYSFATTHPYPNIDQLAASGDLYELGRPIAIYINLILMVFRATKDLLLLDQVDSIMQLARGTLIDTNGDGYPNWRWLAEEGDPDYGNDLLVMDEIMTHSMVAQVAWAFTQNKALVSPSGIDYAERATFWSDYRAQWESKWRGRNNKPTGFPFLEQEIVHPYLALVRYLWYAYRLTGGASYLTEATRLGTAFKSIDMKPITTPERPGLVWPHMLLDCDPAYAHYRYLQPFDYAGYSAAWMMDMALDGFPVFTIEGTIVPIANTIAAKVIDNGANDFAPTIGGREAIGGIVYPSQGDFNFPQPNAGDMSYFTLLEYAPFDATGKIAATIAQVHALMEVGHVDEPSTFSQSACAVIARTLHR